MSTNETVSAMELHRGTASRLTASMMALCTAAIPIQVGENNPFAPSDIFLAVAAISILPRIARLPNRARVPSLALLFAILMSGLMTLSRTDQYAIDWAAVRMVGFVLLLAYFCLYYKFFSDNYESATRHVKYLVLSTTIVNLLLLRGAPTRGVISEIFVQKWDSRLSGALYDPNANGALIAVCLLFVMFGPRDLFNRDSVRVLCGVILAIALTMTFSRGAAVAMAVGVVYCTVSIIRHRPRVLARITFAMVAVVAFAFASGVSSWVAEQYDDRPASSLGNRFVYVDQSIESFAQSPLFGAGLGHGSSTSGAVTHATFFWLLGDSGIFAAAGFSWLLVAAVTSALGHRMSPGISRATIGAILCLAVSSLSFEALYQRHLWLLLGLAFAIGKSMLPRHEVSTYVPAHIHRAGRPRVSSN